MPQKFALKIIDFSFPCCW